ncbi:proteasome accessory factor A [Raineyella antarctica]|uniref:Pup--protein ligase n=1 Tax=Raineyella antarctica TaxID=1577474 RepID=A0A1G6GRR2_9ACTN|nr:Pup--protein ligase [Raineyella antarctica]SDB84707.1 proteasome accessory factor A [Raineyella antarctica]
MEHGQATTGTARSRRIYGLETEYGLTSRPRGQRSVGPEEIARQMFRGMIAWGRSSNVFLGNGSRIYLDVGSHPEYATAECDDLYDLVAHDAVGNRLVEDLRRLATDQLAQDGTPVEIFLFKNNVDSAGNSYGCHENYLVDRSVDINRYYRLILPFLVSRQLIAGAGHLSRTRLYERPDRGGDGPAVFQLSQRADQMWDTVSSATTRSRPMINTRDEPHGDPELYRRLHVIVGDSSMSQTTTLLKVGATELVLRLAEARIELPDLTLDNPNLAIRQISRDLTGRTPVELANGRTTTGLEIQSAYLQAVLDHQDRLGPMQPGLLRALELWQRTLTAIGAGDLDTLSRDIDWAIKHRLISRYADRHGLAPDSPRLAQLDLAYHDIADGRGLFRLLDAHGEVSRVVDDAAIERALTTPPPTRARLRGAFIDAARAAGVDYLADWMHLRINRGNQTRALTLRDPFQHTDERVDAMIAALDEPLW